MIQKVEGSFYETYSNISEEIPSIQLTNKNFYGGFALGQTPFIDETIYYPKLEFWRGERIGGEWSWTYKDLELVRCQLDYFDPKYWDLFRDKPLNDLYCIKDLNETLEGHQHERTFSYFFVTLHSCHNKTKNGNDCKPKEVIDQYLYSNVYSYFFVTLNSCHNKTKNGSDCKPKEVIEQYLYSNVFQFFIQDINLTPLDFYNPSQITQKMITGPVFKNLYQKIYAYMQIINVETDDDYLGLSAFTKINSQKLLKYDESWIIAAPNENQTYEQGLPFCEITVQLSEKVLTQKRTFTKITEIFGEIGGTMEVVYIFFNVFVSFIAGLLYKTALVNNLFSFDLSKKIIKLKENKSDILESNESKENQEIKENKGNQENQENQKNLENQKTQKNQENKDIKDKFFIENNSPNDITNKKSGLINNDILNNLCNQQGPLNLSKNMKKVKRKKRSTKTTLQGLHNLRTSAPYEINSGIPFNNDSKKEDNSKNSMNDFNLNLNNNFKKANTLNIIKLKIRKNVINKIEVKKVQAFLCFLCIRKRKKVENLLLDEGIKLISNKLDITNIFKKIYICEKIKEHFDKDGSLEIIDMPEDLKRKIQEYN